MCYKSKEDMEPGDYETSKNSRGNNQTYYKDGTSTEHVGGPCGGDYHYDDLGEEC